MAVVLTVIGTSTVDPDVPPKFVGMLIVVTPVGGTPITVKLPSLKVSIFTVDISVAVKFVLEGSLSKFNGLV